MKRALDVLTSIGLLGASVAVVWSVYGRGPGSSQARPLPIPDAPLAISGLRSMGTQQAPVVMMVFSDFQCPYCGKFAAQTMPGLKDKYVNDGRLTIIFRHLPLTAIHKSAMSAARAAECAGDHFWSFHDGLFRAPQLSDQTFIDTALATGLSETAFRACLESPLTQSAVEKDVAEADKLNVASTPTFLLGRRVENNHIKVIERIAGNRSVAELSAVIDRIGGWPSSEQR